MNIKQLKLNSLERYWLCWACTLCSPRPITSFDRWRPNSAIRTRNKIAWRATDAVIKTTAVTSTNHIPIWDGTRATRIKICSYWRRNRCWRCWGRLWSTWGPFLRVQPLLVSVGLYNLSKTCQSYLSHPQVTESLQLHVWMPISNRVPSGHDITLLA